MKYVATSTKDGEITLIVPEDGGDAVCRVFKPEFADAIAEAVTAASFVPAHPIECEGAKFCVHVYGPDDMIPVMTWNAALEMANRLNAEFVKHRETATENDAVSYAVAEAHPAAPQSNNGEA